MMPSAARVADRYAQKLNDNQLAVFEALEFHRHIPKKLRPTLFGMVKRDWVQPTDNHDPYLATKFGLTPEGRQTLMQYVRQNMARTARRLSLGPGRTEQQATTGLQDMKRLRAKNQGDLNSAVISAGFYAKKYDQTMYVYRGNSYGHIVFNVSYKPGDYLDPINNMGDYVYAVTPELVVTRHDISGR